MTKLLKQTPHASGVWGDVQFTIDRVDRCDFLLIADLPNAAIRVTVPPENVWSFVIEPPNTTFKHLNERKQNIARVYTADPTRTAEGYVRTFVPIDWFIGKSFDELVTAEIPTKSKHACMVMSNMTSLEGHRKRMAFLQKLNCMRSDKFSLRAYIQKTPKFDLYGRGFRPFQCKWDISCAYRKCIVIENHSNSLYWSGKLADAYLAYCLPVYFGCTRINDFFPKESVITIDINSSSIVKEMIEILSTDDWGARLEAIKTARDRVLYEYNFFPFFAREIANAPTGQARELTIPQANFES